MRRHQLRSIAPSDWHPALRALVESAAEECPRGHAEALRAMTTLALRKAPSRGVFDPAVRGEEDLFSAIEAIAIAHLHHAEAKQEWRKTLQDARMSFDQQDAVERAALHVQAVSDTAYFYAGLAFGLAYAYVNQRF